MSDAPNEFEQAKLKAEAEKFRAEARKARVEAELSAAGLEMQQMHMVTARRDHAFHEASDLQHRTYRFRGTVDYETVSTAVEHLSRWSRMDPGCDITLVINSPGGYVTWGMDLFDTLLELRANGHKVTGVGRGYVASMGSVLLQACDWRVMGPGCAMLIHEPSGLAAGSLGEIADTKSWLDMTASRMLDVYADRCASSDAEKPFTRTQLKSGWNRKDWWLNSESCLKGGLIDEIR